MNMIASLPHNKQKGLKRKGIESSEGSVMLQVTPTSREKERVEIELITNDQ